MYKLLKKTDVCLSWIRPS